MKPTNYAYACSMSLGDNPEQARERYESLRSELIKMGYEEGCNWYHMMSCISINWTPDVNGMFVGATKDSEAVKRTGLPGPYNRSLFLAIAAQKVGGGVGRWYVGNESKIAYKCVSQLDQFFLFCRGNDTTFTVHEQVLLEDYHLATIAELIEAFPNEDSSKLSAPTEPEPRKIKKGDRLLCVKGNAYRKIIAGDYYPALEDEYMSSDGPATRIRVGNESHYVVSADFTIANEEAEPVKEERSIVWNHTVAIRVGGEQIAFNVCKDRIQMQLDNGKDRPEHVDVTHLLRAVLAKYDELKAL